MASWKTSVGRLRWVGGAEGVSFLLLMGVAMPLKYGFGIPEAVKWAGWVHGVLFILYGMTILLALLAGGISIWRAAVALLAAFLPFGPFLIDRRLAADEAAQVHS